MSFPSSSPDTLARDPELAAIEVLEYAADTARRALFAEYPELARGDVFVDQVDVSAQQCLAVALLKDIDALTESVEQYRAHLINLASTALARVHDTEF